MRECSVANGLGVQRVENGQYNTCHPSCHVWYTNQGSTCVPMVAPTCPAWQAPVNYECQLTDEVVECSTSNGIWQKWLIGVNAGICKAVACNPPYAINNGQCILPNTYNVSCKWYQKFMNGQCTDPIGRWS